MGLRARATDLWAFRGIYKLPPAHGLTLDLPPAGPVRHVERYWALEYSPKWCLREEEAAEALREKLTEAVRLRMISDVPLGAFLSGGIDSSIVVGLMAGLSDRPVQTFSSGFKEAAYNELEHARRVAQRWGTKHDVQSYLPYDLLVKVDITSMANSLEARSPFLDHEVMEFAARLPVGMKLHGHTSKYLLKRAFADLLPIENVRRRKMGFGVPVGEWFRGPLRSLLEDALLSEQARKRGYFQPETLHRLVTEHLERQADHTFALWNLLMLELWHREFIDKC